MARKYSRKSSRRPQKSSRRYRKSSRRPRKSSKRPRKTSRRYRKSSRKSRKTSRRYRKTSRKSYRKSRKTLRKSSRRHKKPRKTSRKSSKKSSRRPGTHKKYKIIPRKYVKSNYNDLETYNTYKTYNTYEMYNDNICSRASLKGCNDVYVDGLRPCGLTHTQCVPLDYNTHLNFEKYKYISGILSFHKYELSIGGIDRTVYLVGEQHSDIYAKTHNDVASIVDVLLSLPNNYPNKTYDYFLENRYKKRSTIGYNDDNTEDYSGSLTNNLSTYGNLVIFFRIIKNCLTISKSKCPYKNARFHYVDLRFNDADNIMTKIGKCDPLVKQRFKGGSTDIECKRLVRYIKEDFDRFYNSVVTETKIGKNLENMDNETADFIMKVFKREILLILTLQKPILNVMSLLNVLLVDYYTITRMFRRFSDNYSAKNMIYYSGDLHTINVANFLKSYQTMYPDKVKSETYTNYVNVTPGNPVLKINVNDIFE